MPQLSRELDSPGRKLLGHKDAAMTQRYAHLADNTLRERSESLSKVIVQSVE